MKVSFNSSGYPDEIIFSKHEKEEFASSNFYSIQKLYNKIKKINDYWEELEVIRESHHYGDLDNQEYYNRMIDQLKKHFDDDFIQDFKRIQVW